MFQQMEEGFCTIGHELFDVLGNDGVVTLDEVASCLAQASSDMIGLTIILNMLGPGVQ